MHQFIFQLTHNKHAKWIVIRQQSLWSRDKGGYLFDIASQISVVLDPGFGHVLTEKALDRRVSLPSIP